MMTELNNKKALITGASGEIGASISRILHKNGCEVCISGRNYDALRELAKEFGPRAHIACADLSIPANTNSLVESALSQMNGIDILVNNAGLTKDNLLVRMTDQDWTDVINVNLNSSMMLMRRVLKPMMKSRWGRIINIASVVGTTGNPGQANYAASKAGLIGISKSVAKEVASRGITVNSIAPGFIRSDMTNKLNDNQRVKILENIPMNILGTADDIGYTALFLASEGSKYITGQTIHVNGGMAMV